MKLLVITQIVDQDDQNLGFFHTWLERLARDVEHLYVICLKKGSYTLPSNVTVLSLGKEAGASRWQYFKRFYQYIFQYRTQYDHVFVHMNPEYVVLGGLWWLMWRKKVLLWYTHKSVNVRLRIATFFVTKIFTASRESFRLPSSKVRVVGHGIDVDAFAHVHRQLTDDPIRLLSVGRISPVKDLETIIMACQRLRTRKINVMLTVVGEAITPQDRAYETVLHDLVKKLDLNSIVQFVGGKPHREIPSYYAQNHILVHTSKTGSVDKVVLEALASGMHVISSSEAFAQAPVVSINQNDPEGLAKTIETMVIEDQLIQVHQKGVTYVKEHHALDRVIQQMMVYFSRV